MNKREAIQAMLDGHRVRRVSWTTHHYVYMTERGSVMAGLGSSYDMNASLEDGWEIYKEPPKKYPIEVWVNVYEGGGYAPHVTTEDAEYFASGSPIARIKLTGVAVEGQYDED